jgi:trans-2,3-dihydro-3-hydroxyanthranilate isomerase
LIYKNKSAMKAIPYYHVDVFTNVPLSGNGLTVFTEADGLSNATMLKVTQETRQFESIFLQRVDDNSVRANIFTCEEELDFAGHPILGAAATT